MFRQGRRVFENLTVRSFFPRAARDFRDCVIFFLRKIKNGCTLCASPRTGAAINNQPQHQMSRKDYIAAAEIIATIPLEYRDRIACLFANMFSADNPRFDRARFLRACEL